MQIAITLTLILNMIGASQAAMLSLVFSLRGYKNQFNLMIAAILLVLAIIIGNTFITLSGFGNEVVFYQDVSNAVTLLLGPLIYLLVKSYTKGEPWTSRNLVHLIPFAIYLPLSLIFGFASGSSKYDFSSMQQLHHLVMPWGWNLQMACYLVLSLRCLRAHLTSDQSNVHWIRDLVMGVGRIWLLNLALYVISRTLFQLPEVFFLNITLLLTLVVVSIAFRSFKDPLIRAASSPLEFIDGAQKKEWLNQLKKIMEDKKLYKHQSLRLSTLAGEIGVKSRLLSSFIQEEFGISFNDYINRYRVNEVINQLGHPGARNYTILGIANEAGFKSNSVFYRSFKQHTGLTPMEYLSDLETNNTIDNLVRNHDS